MAVSFDGFCAYGRISVPALEEDGESFAAQLCLTAALDHAKSAGIDVDRLTAENNAKFELYIYALALHWFDNRGFQSVSQTFAGDEYTKRIMTRMRVELAAEGLRYGI